MNPAQRVAADLRYIAERYDDFHQARLKGTPRPWQQPQGASGRDAVRTELARTEHAERTALAIGEHPAPLHLDVFDALIDLLATADELADRVSQEAGVDRLPYPRSAMDDAAPYLRHAAEHLQGVGHDLLAYVAEHVTRLRSVIDRHLGELTTGQRLLAECPWCRGVTDSHPGGGAFTLRVRQSGGDILIVCESGGCEPTEADCGLRHRGMPAWDLHTEGAWLADRIEKHKEQAA